MIRSLLAVMVPIFCSRYFCFFIGTEKENEYHLYRVRVGGLNIKCIQAYLKIFTEYGCVSRGERLYRTF